MISLTHTQPEGDSAPSVVTRGVTAPWLACPWPLVPQVATFLHRSFLTDTFDHDRRPLRVALLT